jgi:hypothetical protein
MRIGELNDKVLSQDVQSAYTQAALKKAQDIQKENVEALLDSLPVPGAMYGQKKIDILA